MRKSKRLAMKPSTASETPASDEDHERRDKTLGDDHRHRERRHQQAREGDQIGQIGEEPRTVHEAPPPSRHARRTAPRRCGRLARSSSSPRLVSNDATVSRNSRRSANPIYSRASAPKARLRANGASAGRCEISSAAIQVRFTRFLKDDTPFAAESGGRDGGSTCARFLPRSVCRPRSWLLPPSRSPAPRTRRWLMAGWRGRSAASGRAGRKGAVLVGRL